MDIQKLIAPAANWTGGTWAERIDQAASLLFLHGYITEAQRSKITTKLEQKFRDGLERGLIVEKSQ